uniref:mannitol 2-dehydrogenase n=1 Tax=Chromera velia CCMP2878 TaxID=1169474 RepID=A0A0G4H6B4_9ALVE|eukprot:Cvel_24864.t1-p1 / transcript=Cvel_24864.t1 / gene=Cvel_24864 / organism=Chromera_velia_CCMP2878 / gene_product=Mannitol dehydrogenase YNR073C, putative / transcript_product=Mannitol dehydrogenase YNR073C, putative / location=Cvel_scaffold2746:8230-12584(+) / protein_length=576 / sequence_SO=supercontig / SO=protein_coding / is_pseudo=false
METVKSILRSILPSKLWPEFDCSSGLPPEKVGRECGRLSTDALESLRETGGEGQVRVPGYERDPSKVKNWILHFGPGNFFRSHQCVFLDEVLNRQAEEGDRQAEWGICAVSANRKKKETLAAQDFLYTVWTRSLEKNRARVVGSLMDWADPSDETEDVPERLAEKETKIVTLTVTEKGYMLKPDGSLDTDNEKVKHDLESLSERKEKGKDSKMNLKTPLGLITAGLQLRYERGEPPFTVMSCDNLPGNGDKVSKAAREFARALGDSDFSSWIESECRFPNDMVDRITPSTTDEAKEKIRENFGITDAMPVVAEDYRKWVLEESGFPCGRPSWEDAGALFVEDVKPYEALKLRVLNGGHFALSYTGLLLGHNYAHEAMGDERISSLLEAYMDEMRSTVPTLPGLSDSQFKEDTLGRFKNPYLKDSLERLAMDGSDKFENQMKEGLHDLAKENGPEGVRTSSFVIAVWISFLHKGKLEGEDGDGNELSVEIVDRRAEKLSKLAGEVFKTPCDPEKVRTFLEAACGDNFSCCEALVRGVNESVKAIADRGIEGALESEGWGKRTKKAQKEEKETTVSAA